MNDKKYYNYSIMIAFEFNKRFICVVCLWSSRSYRGLVYPCCGASERLVNLSRLNLSVPYQSFGSYKVIELQKAYVECMRVIVCICDSRIERERERERERRWEIESIIYSLLSRKETRFLQNFALAHLRFALKTLAPLLQNDT